MKPFVLALLICAASAACSSTPAQAPDISDSLQKSLTSAGFKDVSVKQDRDKGVVTLSGSVTNDADKASAESIAKSMAGSQVVADEIKVLPVGMEGDAKTVVADVDKAIEKNLDAALVAGKMNDGVSYKAESGVVTLTGSVKSQALRTQIEKTAAAVPNVKQVVNKLDVKGQKATSTK